MPTKHAQGQIAVVQEERFRLITDAGAGLLLTLAHSANVGPEQLCRYHEGRARVTVDYTGEPNMADGVAHGIWPLEFWNLEGDELCRSARE